MVGTFATGLQIRELVPERRDAPFGECFRNRLEEMVAHARSRPVGEDIEKPGIGRA
jgi:hypothetical protein